MIKTDVVLGLGNTVITDVYNDAEKWAGITISSHEDATPGVFLDLGVMTDDEMPGRIRISSENPQSFDVMIAALERAKGRLYAMGVDDGDI